MVLERLCVCARLPRFKWNGTNAPHATAIHYFRLLAAWPPSPCPSATSPSSAPSAAPGSPLPASAAEAPALDRLPLWSEPFFPPPWLASSRCTCDTTPATHTHAIHTDTHRHTQTHTDTHRHTQPKQGHPCQGCCRALGLALHVDSRSRGVATTERKDETAPREQLKYRLRMRSSIEAPLRVLQPRRAVAREVIRGSMCATTTYLQTHPRAVGSGPGGQQLGKLRTEAPETVGAIACSCAHHCPSLATSTTAASVSATSTTSTSLHTDSGARKPTCACQRRRVGRGQPALAHHVRVHDAVPSERVRHKRSPVLVLAQPSSSTREETGEVRSKSTTACESRNTYPSRINQTEAHTNVMSRGLCD
jgi:hypothetical protein